MMGRSCEPEVPAGPAEWSGACPPDLTDWVRVTALDAMADALLAGHAMTATGQVSQRIRAKLIERATCEWTFNDGIPPLVTVSTADSGEPCDRRSAAKYVVVTKKDMPEVWIRVDAVRTSTVALELTSLAARGCFAVWVRWGGARASVPRGVTVVDLTAARCG